MRDRISIFLDERAPLKRKVLLHRKFVERMERRRLDHGARGKTMWTLEFLSERESFTICWRRRPRPRGPLSFPITRLRGTVTIRFSRREIDQAGVFLITGDWRTIEDQMFQTERVS